MTEALNAAFSDRYAIVRELGWTWKRWSRGRQTALGVVAPYSTHVVLPFEIVKSKLEPGADVTLLLLFRMLAAGDLPRAARGSASLLG